MIIVGRSNSNKIFETSIFTYIQNLYKKGSIHLHFYFDCFYDVFTPKYFLGQEDKISCTSVFSFLSDKEGLLSKVQDLLKNREVPLKLIQIDKKFSCIGIDYYDCLRKIDLSSVVRKSLADSLGGEAQTLAYFRSLEEFSELVSQEGADNYICKGTVTKLYGSYTLETLYKFLNLLVKASSTEIEEKYLPKNTPLENELIKTLLQGKIFPVFRTGRSSGKPYVFKGFFPYIMINTDVQEIYANNKRIPEQGKDLLNLVFQRELPFSSLESLENGEGIIFEPSIYTGKTFTFKDGASELFKIFRI